MSASAMRPRVSVGLGTIVQSYHERPLLALRTAARLLDSEHANPPPPYRDRVGGRRMRW